MAKSNVLMAALQGFKRGAPQPDTEDQMDQGDDEAQEGEPMEDPRSMSQGGDTLLIDADMFPKGCKVGDKVQITGTVESHGTKFGVVPEGITAAKDGSGYGDQGQEEEQ